MQAVIDFRRSSERCGRLHAQRVSALAVARTDFHTLRHFEQEEARLHRRQKEMEDQYMVREIGLDCTCWWYSLCNFQCRQHYEHSCSDHFDC